MTPEHIFARLVRISLKKVPVLSQSPVQAAEVSKKSQQGLSHYLITRQSARPQLPAQFPPLSCAQWPSLSDSTLRNEQLNAKVLSQWIWGTEYKTHRKSLVTWQITIRQDYGRLQERGMISRLSGGRLGLAYLFDVVLLDRIKDQVITDGQAYTFWALTVCTSQSFKISTSSDA